MKENGMQLAVDRLSFTADELRLFLDTHPRDRAALNDYRRVAAEREKAMEAYTQCYGALNALNAGEKGVWDWVQTPWPWENTDRED